MKQGKSKLILEMEQVLTDLHNDGLISSAELPHGQYNCWGFAALKHGFEDKPRWLDRDLMNRYLKDRTKLVVGIPEPGDIGVFRREDGWLLHTTIVYETGNTTKDIKFIHKPGGYCLELVSLHRMDHDPWYYEDYGHVTEYRRKEVRLNESTQ